MSASSTKKGASSALIGLLALMISGALGAFGPGARLLSPAEASVFEVLSLDDLIERAELIVEGRVARRNYRSVPRGGVIKLETHIELEIHAIHHGGAHLGESQDRLRFKLPGGKSGDREQIYLGVPELSPREEILAFFTMEEGAPQLLGWVQGLYRISRERDGSASARRDLGGTFIDRRGRMSEPARASMPLDQLRQTINSGIQKRELDKGRKP